MNGDQERGTAAQSILDARALRRKIFPSEIFDEFAWNILLVLFVGFSKGEVLSEETVFQQASVSTPAGLRWIAHLVKDGQVVERNDGDAIILTQSAITRFRVYFDESQGNTEADS